MGRPKKNPEYNPEEQFQKMLEDVKDAYENADSLRSLAGELNMTLLKLRKLLITAGVFTSDICMEVNQLHEQKKTIPEIMKITGLSRASVHSYLPYCRGVYNAEELSLDAKRCRTYRERMESVKKLQLNPTQKNLWETIEQFEDYLFITKEGIKFRYFIKIGRNQKRQKTLLISLKKETKEIKWPEIKEFWKIKTSQTENKEEADSYLEAIFERFEKSSQTKVKELTQEERQAVEQEKKLWEMLQQYQDKTFQTVKGLDFTYKIKGNEMFIDRKEKSITKASVMLAFQNLLKQEGMISGPKKLGTFGASYLYPIFVKLGLIRTSKERQEKYGL